ncbi:MAG: hypothetical protein VX642_12845 [Bdellovibrionota bacterium]|nr:hypothetical protein [Bdellovibrionota bacterium]
MNKHVKSCIRMIPLLFLSVSCEISSNHEGESDLPSVGTDELIINAELEAKALEVLSKRCLNCHNNLSAAFGVNLEGDTKQLIQRNFLSTNGAEYSYLYQSIIGSNSVSLMPPNNPLNAQEKLVIEDWLNEGISAPDSNIQNYYYSDVKEILENKCTSCHSPGSGVSFAEDYLPLSTYEEVLEIVSPGSPDSSLLWDSVSSGGLEKDKIDTSGTYMINISDEEMGIIYNWINQGANFE